mmetsp:Transcript_1305/g.3965  ORF Transcript_1305/g.3965 Transcript_1305/m.3965 type:complete len:101 (+) Transcript_1305:38-340(+)
MRAILLAFFVLIQGGAAFQVASPAVRPSLAVAAGKKDTKKGSAWDRYTEGEYGQAFKFPWEEGVEATDKTAIGHIIPVVSIVAILGGARLQEMGADSIPM